MRSDRFEPRFDQRFDQGGASSYTSGGASCERGDFARPQTNGLTTSGRTSRSRQRSGWVRAGVRCTGPPGPVQTTETSVP